MSCMVTNVSITNCLAGRVTFTCSVKFNLSISSGLTYEKTMFFVSMGTVHLLRICNFPCVVCINSYLPPVFIMVCPL